MPDGSQPWRTSRLASLFSDSFFWGYVTALTAWRRSTFFGHVLATDIHATCISGSDYPAGFCSRGGNAGTHEQAFGLARQQMEREGHLESAEYRGRLLTSFGRRACVRAEVWCVL